MSLFELYIIGGATAGFLALIFVYFLSKIVCTIASDYKKK